MKRKVLCFLSIILCICFLGGCSLVLMNKADNPLPTETKVPEATEPVVTPPPAEEDENKLPGSFPMEFYFSSGAGAWGTELILKKDGSFTGSYHDSNMGETGEGYPNGTLYEAEFEGAFGNVKKINDYTYKMSLIYVKTKKPAATEWIEDGVLHVAAGAHGIEDGEDFIFYTPDAKVDSLSEEFLSWWPHRFDMENAPDTLSCYGIYNLDGETGFFSY